MFVIATSLTALMRNDTKTAFVLVNVGADPNTRLVPSSAPSLKLLFDQLLHPSMTPTSDSPTAFVMACGAHWIRQNSSPDSSIVEENLPLVQAMLAHNANAKGKMHDSITVLHVAADEGRWRTAQLLLQRGATPNVQDSNGITPLMLAATHGYANIAEMLLASGANPNLQDGSGETALYHALYGKDPKGIVPNLVAHGINPSLRDKQGVIPLQYVRQSKRPDLVRLLQSGAM